MCSGMHAGIFLAQHPEREEVYLTRRKGFVKLAIQGGAGKAILYCSLETRAVLWHMVQSSHARTCCSACLPSPTKCRNTPSAAVRFWPCILQSASSL